MCLKFPPFLFPVVHFLVFYMNFTTSFFVCLFAVTCSRSESLTTISFYLPSSPISLSHSSSPIFPLIPHFSLVSPPSLFPYLPLPSLPPSLSLRPAMAFVQTRGITFYERFYAPRFLNCFREYKHALASDWALRSESNSFLWQRFLLGPQFSVILLFLLCHPVTFFRLIFIQSYRFESFKNFNVLWFKFAIIFITNWSSDILIYVLKFQSNFSFIFITVLIRQDMSFSY